MIGAEGWNRAADTGIFRPIIIILTKAIISVNYFDFIGFFCGKEVGRTK